MKRTFHLFLSLSALLFLAVAGCNKEIAQIYLQGGNAPALEATVTGTIPLSFVNQDKDALSVKWTNPEYKLTTGVSSLDVNYILEIDTTGANFTNPNKQTLTISKELSRTFKQSELNDYLLNQLLLKPAMPHAIEIRVKSGIGANNAAPLVSNVLKFTVTPYAIPPKVAPPASGKLYITGSATPGNWMSDNPPSPVIPAQTFTKVSETQYELTLPLIGGGSYVFVPVFGNWSSKYAIGTKNDPTLVNGGDFNSGGEDILAPAASGNYKIVVDFQRGKFTVTPQ
jgi:hypothetical protein